MIFDRLGRTLLFSFEPETAHGLSISALKAGLPMCRSSTNNPALAVQMAGLAFKNPLGVAAGFDKNAEVPDALLDLGFGFTEVGTLTPLPQSGNPKPRIFRLEEDQAVINRMGFNNQGYQAALERLEKRRGRHGIVGVNIGANKDSSDRIADYRAGVECFARVASYLAVNVSSPNTPGLRNLQARSSLAELLAAVVSARDEQTKKIGRKVPVFLKIAPDLAIEELDDIAAEVQEKAIEGVIVSNTTLSRKGLLSKHSSQAGGLSGKPLFARSTAMLARMRRRLGPDVAIIGVGGVDSAQTALEKVKAGADLIQLYTGFIYGGPSLPGRVLADLAKLVDQHNVKSVSALRDSAVEKWEAVPLD